ncbi:MAG: hypothetical protein P4N24_15130 [Acidobacteriota bacterium]|nr:hypothetical protein [Acidobacteriota bacterium]
MLQIHYSPALVPMLSSYKTTWRYSVLDLWFGLLFGVVAVMIGNWLYAPEKQS